MKKLFYYALALFCMATLTACTPNGNPEPEKPEGDQLIAKIASAGNSITFEYDSQDRIRKITLDGEDGTDVTAYEYPSATTVRETSSSGINTYTLNGEGQAASGVLDDGDGDAGSVVWTYGNGYVSTMTVSWDGIGGTAHFVWKDGNMESGTMTRGKNKIVYAYKYGSVANQGNLDLNVALSDLWPAVLPVGKRSACLMTEMVYTEYTGTKKSDESTTSYRYETDSKGNVTKIYIREDGDAEAAYTVTYR